MFVLVPLLFVPSPSLSRQFRPSLENSSCALGKCVCACVYVQTSPVMEEDRSGVELPRAWLDSCRQNSSEWQLGHGVTLLPLCVCVCAVTIALGVFRYNERSQQYVWPLYVGQLRTASRAPNTSVSFQLNRLKLVTFLLQKLNFSYQKKKKKWCGRRNIFFSGWVLIHTSVCSNTSSPAFNLNPLQDEQQALAMVPVPL